MAPKEYTDAELIQMADEAWTEAWDIANSEDGWKTEKKNDHGDVVVSKKNKKGKRIYRVKAIIDLPAEKLVVQLKDTDKMCDWNTTLTKHDILKHVSDQVKISYQVTAEGGPGGVVSARDFIFLFKNDYIGDAFVQGGCSIEYPGPKNSKIVRAWNGPGVTIIRPLKDDPSKLEFVWLMDCDYRGWIPQSILELAMPVAQLQFIDCVRKLANKIKEN